MSAYLPVGSVVKLKEQDKRVVIIGILQKNTETNKVYDYIGCLYPEGFLGGDSMLMFNKSDIDKIDYLGFVDAEYQSFMNKVKNIF